MPNTFIAFVQEYIKSPEQEQEFKEKDLGAPMLDAATNASRKNAITATIQTLKKGERSDITIINNLFKDLPLQFTTATPEKDGHDLEQNFSLISPTQMHTWGKKLSAFLTTATIEKETQEVALLQKNGSPIKHLITQSKLSAESSKEINALFDEIIAKASEELLDQHDQLKQEIIEVFGLQHIIDTTNINEVKAQVIYAYCRHIVFKHLLKNIDQYIPQKTSTAVKDDFFTNVDNFINVIQNIFFTLQKAYDIEGNEILVSAFFPDFENAMQSPLKLPSSNKFIFEECAIQLAKLRIKKIASMMDADFDEIKLLNKQFNQLPNENQKNVLLQNQVRFWIDICSYYKEQFSKTHDENYYRLLQTILPRLQKKIPLVTLSKRYAKKYADCKEEMSKASQSHEFKHVDDIRQPLIDPVTETAVSKLLHANTNVCILEKIIKEATVKKLFETDIATLQEYKSKIDFIQQSPTEMVNALANISISPPLFAIVSEYKMLIEQGHFFERMQADIEILRSVFKKLPTDINVFPIPNPLIPAEEMGERASYSLSEIFESVNALAKTTPKSNAEYKDLKQNYSRIVKTLVNGLINAFNDSLIRKKIDYINANEKMSWALKDFQNFAIAHLPYLLTKLDGDNFNLDVWQKEFALFCKEYSKHLQFFKDFYEITETLEAPSEGDIATLEEKEAKAAKEAESRKETFQKMSRNQVIANAKSPANKLQRKTNALAADGVARDSELLDWIHKVEKRGKHPYILPEKPAVDLKSEFPNNAAQMLKITLQELSLLMYEATKDSNSAEVKQQKWTEAARLLPKLPPQIVKNLLAYSSITLEQKKAGMLHTEFRAAYVKAAHNDMEEKFSPSWQVETMRTAVLAAYDSPKNKIRTPKNKKTTREMIQHISAVNPAEFIMILVAEKHAVSSGNRAEILAECIEQAKEIFPIDPSINLDYFKNAVALLQYASRNESTKLFASLTNKTPEIKDARSIAHLLIQAGLQSFYNDDGLSKKQEEIFVALQKALSISNDKEFQKLLTPLVEQMKEELDKLPAPVPTATIHVKGT